MTAAIIAFAGERKIAQGARDEVAATVASLVAVGETMPVQIFDAVTSDRVELDFRTPVKEPTRLASDAAAESNRGRGRPKLGVVAREVTLLPRHWDWLAGQSGGASAALRRLVETARREESGADETRRGRESLHRFLTAMVGDAPGYEEALRALYAGDVAAFEARAAAWACDIRDHALALSAVAFTEASSPLDSIPKPHRDAARRAIAAAFPGAAVSAVEPMAPGASGAQVFRVAVAGGVWVLRIDGPASPHGDPARHVACLRIAADAGVASAVAYADPQLGLAITRLVTPLATQPPLTPRSRMAALAGALKRLHAAPAFPEGGDYLETLGAVVRGFVRSGLPTPEAGSRVWDLWLRLSAAYPWDGERVPSHGDLNPSNVIFEGAWPWLVDWQTAAPADRHVDLAAAANWFARDRTDVEELLSVYFQGPPAPEVRARFEAMRRINCLFYGVILLISAASAGAAIQVESADLIDAPELDRIRGDMPAIATAEGRRRFGLAFLGQSLRDPGPYRMGASVL